jgi:hypothetical protein
MQFVMSIEVVKGLKFKNEFSTYFNFLNKDHQVTYFSMVVLSKKFQKLNLWWHGNMF